MIDGMLGTLFTGVKDVDRLILLRVEDYITLNAVSHVNRYTGEICNNYFFMKCFEQKFGFVLSDPDTNYRRLYHKMINIDTNNIIEYGCKEGILELVIYRLKMYNSQHDHYKYKYIINNSIIESVRYGNLNIVKYLMSEPLLTEYLDCHDQEHSLALACAKGYFDIVKFLVENFLNRTPRTLGCDIPSIYADNYLPFRMAAEHGHLDIVNYFIEIASAQQRKRIIGESLLLKMINAKFDEPLILSALKGHLSVVECLISNGADIHTRGDLALTLAAQKGHLPVVEYLVEFEPNGANIHAENESPFWEAVCYIQLPIVKYLIKKGVDIRSNDNAISRLLSLREHTEIVDYILDSRNYS